MSDTNNKPNPKINLFENIALTFSGGGYRASTFSLGILAYFNEVKFKNNPLLKNVTGLSTVSGGTLTGATYASFQARGDGFEEFYQFFYGQLEQDKLLGNALSLLESNDTWKNNPHKKRSLINAFALAYKDMLTDITFKGLKEGKSHLRDVCFNATDFSFGLAFRFQTTGAFGNYRLQNGNLSLLSNEMLVADAIASSSCFPMGFEPMIMPDDFVKDHNSDAYIAIKVQDKFKKGVGIMDGGIVDNQGIGSIMNTDVRRKNDGEPAFDLIMVCDVGSYFMDPWEQSTLDIGKKGGGLSLKQIFDLIVNKAKSIWWLAIPLLTSVVFFMLHYAFNFKPWTLIVGSVFGTIGVLAAVLRFYIGKYEHRGLMAWNRLMKLIPGFISEKLHFFQNLKIKLVQRMLEERGTSAAKMIGEIFLKQIRRLNYNLFYKDDNLKNRRITALIYELTKKQYQHNDSDEKGEDDKNPKIQNPGDRIFAAAKIASEMGTTLWFSEKDKQIHRLKNLISCGMFTACYNLLKYCHDLKDDEADVDQDQLDQMIKVFEADWKRFIDNPYWLFEKLDPKQPIR